MSRLEALSVELEGRRHALEKARARLEVAVAAYDDLAAQYRAVEHSYQRELHKVIHYRPRRTG